MKDSQNANTNGNPRKVHTTKEGLQMAMTANNMHFLVTKYANVYRTYLKPGTERSYANSYMAEYTALSICKEEHYFKFDVQPEKNLGKPDEISIYIEFEIALREYLKLNNIEIIDED